MKSSVRDFKTLNIRLILNLIHKNECKNKLGVVQFLRVIQKMSGGTEKGHKIQPGKTEGVPAE
jgi:hypothetical protein